MTISGIAWGCLVAWLVCLPACGNGGSGGASSTSSGGSSSSGSSGSASGTGSSSSGSSSRGSSGASSGSSSGGSSSGPADSGGTPAVDSGAGSDDAALLDGAANTIPTGYTGTPFKRLTIPGTIYAADYDKGGAGVAFCHAAGVATAAACALGIKLNDWCCGTLKGCDERLQPAVCPTYRADADNAGLSHMNMGEPDMYAATGPTWVPGPNGPTLTGPMAMAGTPVPQDANTTMTQDVYVSYMQTGQWLKYTVEVLEAGRYTVGGMMGVPAGTSVSLDFGNGIGTGTFMLPVSPIANCRCPETYHSWNIVSNLAMVMFPTPGTYLMTLTLVTQQFNPLYFTFTKM